MSSDDLITKQCVCGEKKTQVIGYDETTEDRLVPIQHVEESHDVSHSELMCVLSGLLCGVAAESGMCYADFLGAMSMHFTIENGEEHYKTLH